MAAGYQATGVPRSVTRRRIRNEAEIAGFTVYEIDHDGERAYRVGFPAGVRTRHRIFATERLAWEAAANMARALDRA